MVEGGEEFYEFIKRLATMNDFQVATGRLPDTDREKRGDEELVLRFFAVKDYMDNYKGNVKEWLDSLMEAILFKRMVFDYERQERYFSNAFASIAGKLQGDAFARYRNGEAIGRLAPAYFEAMLGGYLRCADVFNAKSSNQLKAALNDLYSSDDFREVTGPGANSVHKLHARIELVDQKIRSLD